MTIFLLVLVLSIDPGFDHGYRPDIQVVDSPQHAATIVWRFHERGQFVNAYLYRVEPAQGRVTRIDMPAVRFTEPKATAP